MSQNLNDDSMTLRQQRDTYLKTFNDNRSGKKSPVDMNIGNLNISSGPNLAMDRSPQGRPKSLKYDTQNQNVRRESAHLRNQREMFLNNFK